MWWSHSQSLLHSALPTTNGSVIATTVPQGWRKQGGPGPRAPSKSKVGGPEYLWAPPKFRPKLTVAEGPS